MESSGRSTAGASNDADHTHKKMKSRRVLQLNAVSSCFLLLGLLSSAYLAFLAGQKTHSFSGLVSLRENIVQLLQENSLIDDGDERMVSSTVDNDKETRGDNAAARLPSGQHLYVDIPNIPLKLLMEPQLLANTMISFIDECNWTTMLSYHCHPMIQPGITCVIIMLDGYMTIHARPAAAPAESTTGDHGAVAFLDFFTQNNNVDLPSLLPQMEQLFAITSTTATTTSTNTTTTSLEQKHLKWGHQLRGYRTGFAKYRRDTNAYNQELGEDVLRRRDFSMKQPLVSAKTKYQRVDIYELHHWRGTSYAALGVNPIPPNVSVYSEHEDDNYNVGPDRALFIDGVLQSSLYGEVAYHEALVHPAMLSHPNPRRVAIIGGGEGATLREVLKHTTVEEAVMIEIDEELTDLSRAYLPEWSDCSDMMVAGNENTTTADTLSCFDDPRATVYFEDAFGFFLDEFGVDDEGDEDLAYGKEEEDGDEEQFDVIIMDALDPDDFGHFVDKLYNDTEFIQSLHDGLAANGVLVVQVGSITMYSEPPDEMSAFYNRALMIKKLEEVGFQSMHVYDEGHCHFYTPWTFLVAFKDDKARFIWERATAADIELQLHQRLHRTKSGYPIIQYFDGAVMQTYQIPPKVVETNHRRRKEQSPPSEPDDKIGLTPEVDGKGYMARTVHQRRTTGTQVFDCAEELMNDESAINFVGQIKKDYQHVRAS